MPRSTRHKSHRSDKHGPKDVRDRSDSEDDRNSKERKPRVDEPAAVSISRVSRPAEPEKRKPSSSSQPTQGKDPIGAGNDDFSGEHGRKRKDRVEDPVVIDRWNGGGEDDHTVDKKPKVEVFEPVDSDKAMKSKLSAADSKSRSSRRREGSNERNEESGSKVESAKPRLEKDSSRRETSGSQYKDVKERDRDYGKDVKERDRDYDKDVKERDKDYSKDAKERDRDYGKDTKERDRERGSERDKMVQDARHERSDNAVCRKQSTKISSSEEEHVMKKSMEISGKQIQDGLRNPEPEKEPDKHIRRRDSYGAKDKFQGEGRESDDRQLSSRDDHTKSSSYKDESHREGRYREKYREDLDRDQRHRDDRGRDERSSRDHTNNRSVNKHFRDENMLSESHKKIKIQDSDHDGSPYVDDHGTKLKDNRRRKRFADENDDHIDFKPRAAKEPREDVEKNASCMTPSSGNHAVKDQSRPSSKQAGSSCRKSLSEEKLRLCTTSRGDRATVSGIRERVSESRSSEKTKPKGARSDELLVEAVTSHYDRTPKSDARASPNPLAEKSPSSASDRRFSDKTGARRSLNIEGQKSSSSKDGRDWSHTKDREQALPLEKSISEDLSQAEPPNSEPITAGPSSFNRTSHLSSSSPSHRLPPPHFRHGIGSPSVLGSYEDDKRVQIGDRKPNSRYRRSGEHGVGRGQGNAWKSAPTWPSPVANGFIPVQHGPPPGFHPAVQQFPAPLFGVRPSMDLNHTGVSYHVHEAPDRFSGHGHPFGWHNPVDDCPQHLQVWDGSNGVFGDESHVYGRPEWDMNRHVMGNRGWEMNADMWKGQNGNVNMELPVPQESEYSVHALSDEPWSGQTGQESHRERAPSERLPADNSDVKRPNDKSPAKNAVETPKKNLHEKTPEPSKTSVPQATKTPNGDSDIRFCCNYLSKLDISLDLVRPELYKKSMSLLGTRDMASGYNVSKQEHPQNNEEGASVAAKSTNLILTSLFPTRTDTVFKRAMSVYKKQNDGRKAMYFASPSACSEVSVAEKLMEIDKQPTSADTALAEKVKVAYNQNCADVSMADADSASNMGEERNTASDTEGFHPGDAKEQQSDSISDAVHFVEGSQSCEVLMTECRVNVSRIHLFPGSTH